MKIARLLEEKKSYKALVKFVGTNDNGETSDHQYQQIQKTPDQKVDPGGGKVADKGSIPAGKDTRLGNIRLEPRSALAPIDL